ncbi:MAG: hypothetical protein AB9842_05050 [Bacteroidales bacterium]
MNCKVLVFLIIGIFTGSSASAQWSADPYSNTVILDEPGQQQVIPKIAINQDGKTYLSWFSSNANNQFNVYMQLLDAGGNKLWAETGLLISDHPTMSWVTDYSLTTDQDGNAILVNQDKRTGNSDVYAYKISPEGNFLWGPDGIALTNDDDFNPSPVAVRTSDGNIVFVWTAENLDIFSYISVCKLSPDGQLLWSNNTIIEEDSMHCLMPQVIASEDSSVIIVWVETRTTDTTGVGNWPMMYPCAQKINSNGLAAWPEKVRLDTLDNMSLQPFNPSLVSDLDCGFYIAWMAHGDWLYNDCFVQHVGDDGIPTWETNGTHVSDSVQYERVNPKIVLKPSGFELFVCWYEKREFEGTNGIQAQRFSATGQKLWPNLGVLLDGWYNIHDTLATLIDVNLASNDDFMMLFQKNYFELSPDTAIIGKMYALRVDNNGNFVWNPPKVAISSANSNKGFTDCTPLSFNQWIIAWSDDRESTDNDPQRLGTYVQNLGLSGTLGPTAGIQQQTMPGKPKLSVVPNPFSGSTCIEVNIPALTKARIIICDMLGRPFEVLYDGSLTSGNHSFPWNADDYNTLRTSQAFFIKLQTDQHSTSAKAVLIR